MRFEIEMRADAGEREREGREALRRELMLLGHVVVERDGDHRIAASELALGVEARRALRVPRCGRGAELRRWSEVAVGDARRLAAALAGLELSERRLALVFSGEEGAGSAIGRCVREALQARGFALIELGPARSAWSADGIGGAIEVGLGREAERRLLACADLAFWDGARATQEPSLLAEVCAHGVLPWLGGGAMSSELLRRLEGDLGPERAARIGEALLAPEQVHEMLAWRERELALGLGEVLRELVRARCDWSVRARCLAHRASEAAALR